MTRSSKLEIALLKALNPAPDMYWPVDVVRDDARRLVYPEPSKSELDDRLRQLEEKDQVLKYETDDFVKFQITRKGQDRLAEQ